MILAGDLGGTKTVLALFEERGGMLHCLRKASFQSAAYGSVEGPLLEFLQSDERRSIRVACLGVAGPIVGGRCDTTNLPWTLEESALSRLLSVPLKLLNDLEATAYGTLHLDPADFLVLDPGCPPASGGNIAVIAAGTGLGEAFLYWDGQDYHPVACEGGHTDFGPRTAEEIALLQYLQDRYGNHVSYERVVSGPGLHDLYQFLRRRCGVSEPPWLSARLDAGDPSATVAEVALAAEDPTCAAALHLFTSLYGAEAGNLALKCMALGGVSVAGGIAPKILPALRAGGFLAAFRSKGRFEPLLRRIPVRVVLNPETALIGAAQFARRVPRGT